MSLTFRHYDPDLIYSTKLDILPGLIDMFNEGYVSTVKNMRKSLIRFELLEIPEFKNEVVMQMIKEHMIPFASDLHDTLTLLAIAPYVLVKRKIVCTYRTETMEVPICLPLGSYEVYTEYTKKFEKRYRIVLIGAMTQPKIHVLTSRFRKGPSEIDGQVCDSDCGIIYHEYARLRQRQCEVDALYRKATAQPIVIQAMNSASTTTQDEIEQAQFSLNIHRKLDQGYEEPPQPELTYDHVNNVIVIPKRYEAARYQPAFPPELLNIAPFVHRFYGSVDMTFGIPVQSAKVDASYMNSRSRSAVDEDRTKTNAVIDHTKSDITLGLDKVLRQIFQDEHRELDIYLPHRTLIDFDNIFFLHREGVIDDDHARDQYIGIVGIHPKHATKGRLIRRDVEAMPGDKAVKQAPTELSHRLSS